MNLKPKISIVLPCYNPKDGWEDTIINCYNALLKQISTTFSTELMVVNDGSIKEINEDIIKNISSKCQDFSYIKIPQNRGKGFALRYAIAKCESDYIVYTDYDFPYEIDNIIETIYLLHRNKLNIVVGTRDLNYLKSLPLKRRIISAALSLANHIFFPKMFIMDTQSGLKGFDQTGREVFMKTSINTYLFDTEFVNMASKIKGLRIGKINLQLRNGVSFSKMTNKVLREELFNYFKLILKSN